MPKQTITVPHNIEAEQAVLGGILIDPSRFEDVRKILEPEYFYIQKHRWVYEVLIELKQRGQPLDFLTITTGLEQQGRLDAVGGAAYITDLLTSVPSSWNVQSYADMVFQTWRRRSLLDVASEIGKTAFDEKQGVDAGLARIQASLYRLMGPRGEDEPPVPVVPPLPESVGLQEVDGNMWLRLYVEHAQAVAPMTPRIFHESAGLWLTSLAVARRIVLPLAFDDIYTNLWIAWIAPTTLWTKSTALKVARKIAWGSFGHLLCPEELTPEGLIADMAGLEPNNLIQLPLESQQEWQDRRHFAAQRGWTLDEFSGLLATAGRDYNAGLLETLLLFYDCTDKYTRFTSGRGMQTIHNAYLTMISASTPTAMALHLTAERLWGMGWWPRFGILTPETARPEWKEPKTQSADVRIVSTLRRLYEELPMPKYPDAAKPLVMRLGDGVHEVWRAYNYALRYELLNDGLDHRLWGAYGRLPVTVCKIAMNLAALTWADDPAITPMLGLEQLFEAINIGETWRASAHRALLQASEEEEDRVKQKVIYQVAKRDPNGVTMRDLCKALKGGGGKPQEIERALNESMLAGEVTLVKNVVGPRGGRPSDRYYLSKE